MSVTYVVMSRGADGVLARRPPRQLAEIPAASAGESGGGGRGGRSASGPRVVRVFVRWRRPPGSAISYGVPPMAFRVACGREVPVAIIDGDEDELELLLYPRYGGGRHVIYLLPFDRRKDPYDAQFELPRPTNTFSDSPAHALGQFLNRIEVRSAAWTNAERGEYWLPCTTTPVSRPLVRCMLWSSRWPLRTSKRLGVLPSASNGSSRLNTRTK